VHSAKPTTAKASNQERNLSQTYYLCDF